MAAPEKQFNGQEFLISWYDLDPYVTIDIVWIHLL